MEEDIVLNVALIVPHSNSLGPGTYIGLWLQGCSLNCPTCQNTAFQPHLPKILISPQDLFQQLSSISDVDGIAISGGEPFQQAKALSQFLALYKKRHKQILIYSGYSDEELNQSTDPHVKMAYSLADVLITGRFRIELKNFRNKIGSPNKEIIIKNQDINKKDFGRFDWEMDQIKPVHSKNDSLLCCHEDSNALEFFTDGQIIGFIGRENCQLNEKIKNFFRNNGISFL